MEHKVRIKYQEYPQLDGTRKQLVRAVGDGSIITRFDKTEVPQRPTDVVCPHFLELKWAYGCPFNCAWCFLKGTLRFLDTKTKPVIKDYCKIQKHLESLFENHDNSCELLNSGELADSLMTEQSATPFSKFIIPLFEKQKNHKVLLLTKSTCTKNLVKMENHDQTIVSFSLNAPLVSKTWEVAPSVKDRIRAAKTLSKHGYTVRVRVDPIVPIKQWQKQYFHLIDDIFANFEPERITFGSLRGLQSTINNASDKTWVSYLTEKSNWGKKIASDVRLELYKSIFNYLHDKYDFTKIAMCKETIEMWEKLDMDYKKIACNCLL
jgi:spore photoproduct lyase